MAIDPFDLEGILKIHFYLFTRRQRPALGVILDKEN